MHVDLRYRVVRSGSQTLVNTTIERHIVKTYPEKAVYPDHTTIEVS